MLMHFFLQFDDSFLRMCDLVKVVPILCDFAFQLNHAGRTARSYEVYLTYLLKCFLKGIVGQEQEQVKCSRTMKENISTKNRSSCSVLFFLYQFQMIGGRGLQGQRVEKKIKIIKLFQFERKRLFEETIKRSGCYLTLRYL